METYKIGDKVRIIPIDGTCDDYPCGFTSSMENMAGKIMTISQIKHPSYTVADSMKKRSKYNGDDNIYKLAEDRDDWDWHSSMFVKVSTDDTVNVCGHPAKIIQAKVSGLYYAAFFVDHAKRCRELHNLSGFKMIAKRCHAIDYDIDQFFPKFNTRLDLLSFVDEMNAMHSSGIDTVLDRAIQGIPVPDLAGENDQDKFSSFTLDEVSQSIVAQFDNIDNLNDFLTTLTPSTSNYANRLQESKTSIRRGNCPEGRKVSSRKDKVAIGIGRLSYRKCHS